MVEVMWTRRALKQLSKIDSRYRRAIAEKSQQLVAFPVVPLDVKKIEGNDTLFRLRVGNYRVIFQLINGEPVVVVIQEVKRRATHTY